MSARPWTVQNERDALEAVMAGIPKGMDGSSVMWGAACAIQRLRWECEDAAEIAARRDVVPALRGAGPGPRAAVSVDGTARPVRPPRGTQA